MERHISWDHPGFRLLAGRKIQIGIAVVAAIGLIGSRVLHASNNPSIIGIMATISGLLFCAYVVFDLRGPPLREGTNTESHRFVAIARSLAGKPLAGFRATPDRRIIVLYGMTIYVIRVNDPLVHL